MAHLAHCYFGFDIYGVEVADLRHICDREESFGWVSGDTCQMSCN